MTDRAIFDEFYRSHYVPVLNYIERRILDQELAQELCTETFIVAWRKFDPAEPFVRTWLYHAAHHLIGNAYRKRERERQGIEALKEQLLAQSDGSTHGRLLMVLMDLPAKDREVLQLTYWEDLNATEVAEVLGCSQASAWKRVSRAKQSLRELYERSEKSDRGR